MITRKKPSILILGDLILNQDLHGKASHLSPDAPIPVLAQTKITSTVGGAANIAKSLAALEAKVTLVGITGQDTEGQKIRSILHDCGIYNIAFVYDGRPTTSKTRILGNEQHIVRIDREDTTSISDECQDKVLEIVRRCLPNVDTVLLADCEKGFFNPTLLAQIIGLAGTAGKRVLVDPSGWDFARYSGASVLLPSLVELGRAFGAEIGIDDAVLVDRAARCVLLSTGAEAVVLSCREKGVWVYQRGMKTIIPAVECAVVDVSGAGDSLVAAFTWILSRGDTILDAAVIGNLAGALAASKDGSVALTSAELKVYVEIPEPKTSSKIVSRLELVGKIAHAKAAGRRVVFTSGYFDLLHSAIDLLQGAKAMGDLLVIGLNSDDSRVGAGGPIVPELQRAKLLAALGCVDYVVPFTEETPLALIEAIRPDILVQGAN